MSGSGLPPNESHPVARYIALCRAMFSFEDSCTRQTVGRLLLYHICRRMQQQSRTSPHETLPLPLTLCWVESAGLQFRPLLAPAHLHRLLRASTPPTVSLLFSRNHCTCRKASRRILLFFSTHLFHTPCSAPRKCAHATHRIAFSSRPAAQPISSGGPGGRPASALVAPALCACAALLCSQVN